MGFNEFMNKVRYLDNITAKWLMRHFYFMFFQIVLMIVFLFWFVNMFNVIDATATIPPQSETHQLVATQSVNMTILTFLIILNSFWILFIFNAIQRALTVLKDISYNISRMRNKNKNFS